MRRITSLILICMPILGLADEKKIFVHPWRVEVKSSDKEAVGHGFTRLDSVPAKNNAIEPWAVGNMWVYRVVPEKAEKRDKAPVKWIVLSLSKKQELGKRTFYAFDRIERTDIHPSSARYWQTVENGIIHSTADKEEGPEGPDLKFLMPWMHLSPKPGNSHDERKTYPEEFTVVSDVSKEVKTPAGTFDCVELMYFVYMPNETDPSIPGTYDLSYYWYARGIGIVASLTSDGMREELVGYKLNE